MSRKHLTSRWFCGIIRASQIEMMKGSPVTSSIRSIHSKKTPRGTHKVWRTKTPGNVYLLCLDGGRLHYIGKTERDIGTRLGEHWRGNGSALTHSCLEAQIPMRLARVWELVDLGLEFQLKTWSGSRRFCPLCSGDKAMSRAKYDDWRIDQ
jgi:predicted GIY-YIG superfamily endonuclease